MLTHTEHGFGSIANILLIIGAGGAFNAILKTSGLADSLAHILSNLHMHLSCSPGWWRWCCMPP
jgi:D-serine transporter